MFRFQRYRNHLVRLHAETCTERCKPLVQVSTRRLRSFSTFYHQTPNRVTPKFNQSGDTAKEEFYSIFNILYYLVPRGLLAFGIVNFASEYVFLLTQCEGPSMLPTMESAGEVVFVDRWTLRRYGIQGGSTGHEQRLHNKRQQKKHSNQNEWYESFVPVNQLPRKGRWERFQKNYLGTGLRRGDVVVAMHPQKEGTICKRIIGLPGDEIILKQSQYTTSHFVGKSRRATARQRKALQKIPDGHVWLEGDNSRNSRDSREYGPVPAAMIVGRVPFRVWRAWPLSGDFILERGMNAKSKKKGNLRNYRFDALQSQVLPAGYEGQRIVHTYNVPKTEVLETN